MQKTLGITAEVYQERRCELFKKMPNASIAILPSADQKFRNHDAEYPFRQQSDFYYLSGFCESNSVLVFIKDKMGAEEFIVFNSPQDPEKTIWSGPRLGVQGALQVLGANKAYAIHEIDFVMPQLLEDKSEILYSLGRDQIFDTEISRWLNTVRAKIRRGVHAPGIFVDLHPFIHELRLRKSVSEIALMRKACEISALAHNHLMRACKPGRMEYELEAEFLHECMLKGCRSLAYMSIVGGGENACTLHYVQNDKKLESGDLVLVDAGGEYQYYAADITRTFPINGRFTADQKAIYNLVLKAQLAAIAEVRPGTHWDKLQEVIVSTLVSGLVDLGILKGNIATLIEEKAYKPFYMHSSGHWLGLDVHDAGEYKMNGQWRLLEPGMALTVEPGLYFAPNNPNLDKRWWGIGVRIEDDILVTETGHEVLTETALKTVEAIEAFMASTSK